MASDLVRRDEAGQKLVNRSHDLERQIIAGLGAIRSAWVALAGCLHEFHEERAWELIGHETLNEFLAQPEIGMPRRQFFRLVQLHEVLVVTRKVPALALEGIDYSKIDQALPAIKAGDVSVEEALADAQALGWRDMRDKYGNGSNPDPNAEPTWCPTCGSRVAANKLEGKT